MDIDSLPQTTDEKCILFHEKIDDNPNNLDSDH